MLEISGLDLKKLKLDSNWFGNTLKNSNSKKVSSTTPVVKTGSNFTFYVPGFMGKRSKPQVLSNPNAEEERAIEKAPTGDDIIKVAEEERITDEFQDVAQEIDQAGDVFKLWNSSSKQSLFLRSDFKSFLGRYLSYSR